LIISSKIKTNNNHIARSIIKKKIKIKIITIINDYSYNIVINNASWKLRQRNKYNIIYLFIIFFIYMIIWQIDILLTIINCINIYYLLFIINYVLFQTLSL